MQANCRVFPTSAPSPPQPARGKEALVLVFPDGLAAGPLKCIETKARWSSGTLQDLCITKKDDVCTCRRELAGNGLTYPQLQFEESL